MFTLLLTPFFASCAMAASLQIRQSAEITAEEVARHAMMATADLAVPGYANIIWPVNRGYSKLSHREFCGGFPASEMRNDFPLSGGKVSMIQQKDITNVRLSYSSVANPTTLDEFTPLASNYSSLSYGLSCTDAPDFAAAGLTAGTNVTIALEYTYGSHAYQYLSCSDVTLVDPSEWQKSLVCINAMVPQAQALAMTNGTSNAVFSLHSDSGLSATAGGGIGASVTLVVIGAVLAALLAMGLLSFGRKSHKVPHELHSNGSGSVLYAEKQHV